jgi:plastocyanin
MSLRRAVALIGATALLTGTALFGTIVAWPTGSGAATTAVDIQDSRFVPSSITIAVGDSVVWTESGVGTHSVTADDASFDSSPSCPGTCLGNGSTFSHAFASPGTYRYYCRIHGGPGGQGMSGTVVVTAAATTTTGESTTSTVAGSTPSVSAAATPTAPVSPAVSGSAALTG